MGRFAEFTREERLTLMGALQEYRRQIMAKKERAQKQGIADLDDRGSISHGLASELNQEGFWPMEKIPPVKIVLIEFSSQLHQVLVRGCFSLEKFDPQKYPPLEEGNPQNFVRVFEGVDMKFHVGFSGF